MWHRIKYFCKVEIGDINCISVFYGSAPIFHYVQELGSARSPWKKAVLSLIQYTCIRKHLHPKDAGTKAADVRTMSVTADMTNCFSASMYRPRVDISPRLASYRLDLRITGHSDSPADLGPTSARHVHWADEDLRTKNA